MQATPPRKTEITRDDIMPMSDYAKVRGTKLEDLVAVKRNRRLSVGPSATFFFENYETVWSQVHEMLHIGQVDDGLAACNPLIPKGRELVATVLFEIDDPVRRKAVLDRPGGLENTMTIQFAGETVTGMPGAGVPGADPDRTGAAGRTSSVHFPFTPGQIDRFRQPGIQVVVGIGHERYGHMAVMPEAVREELARDLDS